MVVDVTIPDPAATMVEDVSDILQEIEPSESIKDRRPDRTEDASSVDPVQETDKEVDVKTVADYDVDIKVLPTLLKDIKVY